VFLVWSPMIFLLVRVFVRASVCMLVCMRLCSAAMYANFILLAGCTMSAPRSVVANGRLSPCTERAWQRFSDCGCVPVSRLPCRWWSCLRGVYRPFAWQLRAAWPHWQSRYDTPARTPFHRADAHNFDCEQGLKSGIPAPRLTIGIIAKDNQTCPLPSMRSRLAPGTPDSRIKSDLSWVSGSLTGFQPAVYRLPLPSGYIVPRRLCICRV
jgi:hypothetical protein